MYILDEKIDELRYIHTTQLAHFAEWCKWDGIMAHDKLWQTAIYDSSDTLFQWTIKAIEDQCPSPQLLKVWKKIKHATCPVCLANKCSLKHILCGCNKALTQNRYTWRHDSILLAVYQATREAVYRGRARFKLTNGESGKKKDSSIQFKSGGFLQNDGTKSDVKMPPQGEESVVKKKHVESRQWPSRNF